MASDMRINAITGLLLFGMAIKEQGIPTVIAGALFVTILGALFVNPSLLI